MANAKEKIFEVEPARWIVAHSGIVKDATASEGLEGVTTRNDAREAELGQQDDDLEDQNHDDHAHQRADDRRSLARVGQVQEDAEDVQRQQRNDDRLNEARDDGAELDEALTQHAARHHRQAQTHHEGQEQRRHHL